MNFDYLYGFTQSRYKSIYEHNIPLIDDLKIEEINKGIILPSIPDGESLFGLGGVVDSMQNFIDSSSIISYGRDLNHKTGKSIRVFGGKYTANTLIDDNREVVYGGYITNHWGHFLVDFTTRLWYMIDNNNSYLAFVIKDGQHLELLSNIIRFLGLLGISKEKIILVNCPTRFKKIIIPQCGYITNGYYSLKHISVFDVVAHNIVPSDNIKEYDKIYFSRNSWYKAKSSESGEEILSSLFMNNKFEIISPEKFSLDDQIFYIRHAKEIASIEGTIPHNMLFANRKQKIVIINKTYNINSMQKDINFMRSLNVTFIDAYLSIFPVPMGSGPFVIIYNECIDAYIKNEKLIPPNSKFTDLKYTCMNISKYIINARRSFSTNSINLHFISDKNNSAFFDPQHITYYYEKYYLGTEKITIIEKLFGKIDYLLELFNKILFRMKDILNTKRYR